MAKKIKKERRKPRMRNKQTEKFIRSLVADRCGGEKFDAPGGGYAFSSVLNEEQILAEKNIEGDPKSALLALSVADPTWKIDEYAINAGFDYYHLNNDSTRYKDNRGVIDDKEDTNDLLADIFGLPSSDWVQYSPGGIKSSLSEYIPEAFFQEDGLFIFPNPGYPVIKDTINNRKIKVVDINMIESSGKWLIPYETIKFPSYTKKRFMYVNDPHNPTGSTMSKREKRDLIKWAIKNRVLLIIDEAYNELRYNNSVSFLKILGWANCCIILKSVSKGWSATGLRFGAIIAHPTAIKVIRKVCNLKHSGGFGPNIISGISCLRNTNLSKKTNMQYKALHRLLYDGLKKAGFKSKMPGAGLCQFTSAPKAVFGNEFSSLIRCAQWFREELRISLMNYEVSSKWYLRWAVTIKPVPECSLPTEESVIREVVRRLQTVKFKF